MTLWASAWVVLNQYAGSQKIFDSEIGKMHGVRYIESTQRGFAGEVQMLLMCGTIILAANSAGFPILPVPASLRLLSSLWAAAALATP